MAVRRWQVDPDSVFETQSWGPIPVVSRSAFDDAMLDGAAMLDRAGGVFTVVVQRHPTDLPGAMVTTSAVMEWKDRTDAKEQPERPAPVEAALPPDPEPEVLEAALEADAEPDGLDRSTLEEEDISSVPVEAR